MDAHLGIDKQNSQNKKYPRSERSKKLKGDLESGFPWGLDLKDLPESEPEQKEEEVAE